MSHEKHISDRKFEFVSVWWEVLGCSHLKNHARFLGYHGRYRLVENERGFLEKRECRASAQVTHTLAQGARAFTILHYILKISQGLITRTLCVPRADIARYHGMLHDVACKLVQNRMDHVFATYRACTCFKILAAFLHLTVGWVENFIRCLKVINWYHVSAHWWWRVLLFQSYPKVYH